MRLSPLMWEWQGHIAEEYVGVTESPLENTTCHNKVSLLWLVET